MAFKSLKRNCPVCGGARKDCRQNTENNLIHCRHIEANPLDYVYLKDDVHGFGMWAEKLDIQYYSEQKREEWKQQKAEERRQREQAERSRHAQSLSLEERDREFRKLLAQLSLNAEDRADLKRRGLTDEEIKRGGFKSVEPWQRLESEVNNRLPGVQWDGRSLLIKPGDEGYLCPIKNENGLIIGCQLRRRAKDAGRYRWLYSRTKKRSQGATSHLPNGELPIAVHRPKDVNLGAIGLCEGTGVKPFVAAQRLGQIVLGAAGGNFAGSPQCTEAALTKLSTELDTTETILYPDGGAIANPHVMGQYQKTYNLAIGLGYSIKVAWWGQSTKDDPDIDELPVDTVIEFLDWDKFLGMSCIATKLSPKPDPVIEPDPDAYKAYCDWEAEQERVEAAQELEEQTNWVKSFFGKLGKKIAKQIRRLERTGREVEPCLAAAIETSVIEASLPTTIKYVPGSLPTFEEWHTLGTPRITYDAGQRLHLWREAVAKGWQHIMDKSAPGLGKSHDGGLASPDGFFEAEKDKFEVEEEGEDDKGRLFYFSRDHRNPTTRTVEANYVDVPIRHNGLLRDSSRKTPMGRDFIVHPRKDEGEVADIPGNCSRAEMFSILREKNFPSLEGEGGVSPVCLQCPCNEYCGKEESLGGIGYGYRAARHSALTATRNRLHPDSAPGLDKFDYSKTVNIWDEAAQLINPMNSIEVSLTDFDRLWSDLEARSPELHAELAPVRLALRQFLTGDIIAPAFGFGDESIREALPNLPENLEDLVERLDELYPKLEDYIEERDGVRIKDNRGGLTPRDKAAIKSADKALKQEAHLQTLRNLANLPKYWLVPFLKVWGGRSLGSLRCDYRELKIFDRNNRHADIAKAAKANFYLDATEQRQFLAMKLDIEAQDILVLEQETPQYTNLRVVHVTGLGRCAKDRSESLQARVLALKAALLGQHPDLKIFEWLTHANEGDGAHFRDTRGSNAFIGASTIACFGIPYQNLGHLQALYQTLTGLYVTLDKNDPDPGFQAFVDATTQAEILQEIGRLRAHKRPDEPLTYYFCANYDLSFLQHEMPGVRLEQVDAFNITPEAGSATQQVRQWLLDGYRLLAEAGEKITTTAIAKAAGITQGRVSQIAASFGGWTVLKKLLGFLYRALYSNPNNFEEPDETIKWLAQEYLPLVLDEGEHTFITLASDLKAIGWKHFEQVLKAATVETRAKLLGLLVLAIAPDWLNEIQSEGGG